MPRKKIRYMMTTPTHKCTCNRQSGCQRGFHQPIYYFVDVDMHDTSHHLSTQLLLLNHLPHAALHRTHNIWIPLCGILHERLELRKVAK